MCVTRGSCAQVMSAEAARAKTSSVLVFMERISFRLFVENFKHVVGGFFAVHDAELLHYRLLETGILLGPGKFDQVVTISRHKQRLNNGFSGLRI